jgi:DNA-binding CsgD family transcriptional regulator
MLVDGLVLERFRPQSSGLVFFLLFALCPAVAAAPFLTLIYGLGVSDELSTLLLVTRQAMLLVLLVVTARFVGRSPWFPLLACIFWNFMLLHLAGIDLGFCLEAVPDVRMAVIFAVAAASVLCLCRFARSLRAVPELAAVAPELSPEEGLPPGEPVLQERQIDAAKLDAFGAAFDLTSRELQTLEFLLRYKEIALIAQGLAISERTVRFHFTGLFRKTGVSNKQRLMHFYTSWEA